jgi:cyclohexanecarboxylate-CoA ligase
LPQIAEFLLSQRVSKTYLPERLEVVEALPRTPSGKIQKFKLRDMAKTLGPAGKAG